MKINSVAHSDKNTVGHAGLALIGEMAGICDLDIATLGITDMKQPQIADADILRSLCGLIAQGKTDFDHIKEFAGDSFFQTALGLDRIPSAEILRQRFQKMSSLTGFEENICQCAIKLGQKVGVKPEYTIIEKEKWVRLDVDVTIFDNADTKKEGAEYTYNNRFGFAPIFAHLGGGWMVNAQLRPGSAHTYAPGTLEFVAESLENSSRIVDAPILFVADSGFDSKELIGFLAARKNTDFIIKHNLRKESKAQWLQDAREHGVITASDTDKTTYRGSLYRKVEGVEEPVRIVFEVTELRAKDGQFLLTPEISVFSAWTSLDVAEKEIFKAYRTRGTSEQYHAEFKSELDMERLPSGKFSVNSAFLKMGMLIYNMFKIIGQDMVLTRSLGLKKATRRRMKTIMRSMIYMCGRIIRHSRRSILQLSCPQPWYEFFSGILMKLKAV